MPSTQTVSRQRSLGGIFGVLVLASALSFHFFPRMFHIDPVEVAQRRAALPGAQPAAVTSTANAAALRAANELEAGPPLILASTRVIAAHRTAARNADLPEQKSADTPQVEALLKRADEALDQGNLVGESDSAATLYAQAIKDKPDSRRAARGLYDVRTRLVVAAEQALAQGIAEDVSSRLAELKSLPDSAGDVAHLQGRLDTLRKVAPMLARAAALLQQGKAELPAGENALEVYRQVQQLDPANVVAQQGVLQVQRVVLDRALAAVAQNEYETTDKALAEAAAIEPDTMQLLDVRQRVSDLRRQRALGVLAQARSALDAGNQGLAQQLAKQADAISPQLPGLQDFEARLVEARLYASYRPGQVFSDRYVDMPGQAPPMVVIPTGSFSMGAPSGESDRSDAELPQHMVTLARGFALSRTAITVGQFREFVRASGYRPDSLKLDGASVYDERSGSMRDDSGASWQDDYAGRRADDAMPVVNVSWSDAKAYVDWLSQRTGLRYRLPSEAEFEYALRGGTTSRYWWGDGVPLSKVENLTGARDRSPSGRRWSHAFKDYADGYWGPAPVMSFQANPFGLYDINGNVSAWVHDCWHDNYNLAPRDGSAWVNPGCRVRVVRGGSWGSSPTQERSAYRQGADGNLRSGRVGIRIARELEAR
jgi:formylglycine-generating enzyme required for sulfatase activity